VGVGEGCVGLPAPRRRTRVASSSDIRPRVWTQRKASAPAHHKTTKKSAFSAARHGAAYAHSRAPPTPTHGRRPLGGSMGAARTRGSWPNAPPPRHERRKTDENAGLASFSVNSVFGRQVGRAIHPLVGGQPYVIGARGLGRARGCGSIGGAWVCVRGAFAPLSLLEGCVCPSDRRGLHSGPTRQGHADYT